MELLIRIIGETTRVYRKPIETLVERPNGVIELWDMPHESEADRPLFDVHFMKVSVDQAKAESWRAELVRVCEGYPRLKQGPSYIEVGAEVGSQDLALRLFALGEALHLWKVITPAFLGATGDEADSLAGMGFVMTSGFNAG